MSQSSPLYTLNVHDVIYVISQQTLNLLKKKKSKRNLKSNFKVKKNHMTFNLSAGAKSSSGNLTSNLVRNISNKNINLNNTN